MRISLVFALIALLAGGFWLYAEMRPAQQPADTPLETVQLGAEPGAQAPAPSSASAEAPMTADPTPAPRREVADAADAPRPAESNEPDTLKNKDSVVLPQTASAPRMIDTLEAAPAKPAATEATEAAATEGEPEFAAIEAPVTASAEAKPAPVTRARAAAPAAAPDLADTFKSRPVAYNRPPRKMFLDRAVDVSLVIDSTAAAAPADALKGFEGEIVEREIDLSDIVSAQLTGVGFEIVPQSVDRQKLSERTANRWQWRVTPTEPGERTLILEIFGYESGALEAEPLGAYRDQISVEVQEIDRVVKWAQGVQPVFGIVAAIAGAISALTAVLRFRSGRKQA